MAAARRQAGTLHHGLSVRFSRYTLATEARSVSRLSSAALAEREPANETTTERSIRMIGARRRRPDAEREVPQGTTQRHVVGPTGRNHTWDRECPSGAATARLENGRCERTRPAIA
jgi:hypothetical protein